MHDTRTIAAFFDLDDTIIVGTNTLYLYIKYLVRHKMMSRWELVKGVWLSFLHKLDRVDVERLLDEFTLPYAGKSEADLVALTKDWFEKGVVPHVAKEAIQKIRWHKEQGHKTVLLSSSSQYVCELMQRELGMDARLNSVVEVKDGKLTGFMQKPLCYHEGKVFYAREFSDKQKIDLAQSYFYTDSVSDVPMLKIVGNPVAVNPDPLLRREALKQGWPVELWREKVGR